MVALVLRLPPLCPCGCGLALLRCRPRAGSAWLYSASSPFPLPPPPLLGCEPGGALETRPKTCCGRIPHYALRRRRAAVDSRCPNEREKMLMLQTFLPGHLATCVCRATHTPTVGLGRRASI